MLQLTFVALALLTIGTLLLVAVDQTWTLIRPYTQRLTLMDAFLSNVVVGAFASIASVTPILLPKFFWQGAEEGAQFVVATLFFSGAYAIGMFVELFAYLRNPDQFADIAKIQFEPELEWPELEWIES